MTPFLSIDGLSKTYGETVANEDIRFEVLPGEIHALLGENGAGKSTLVKSIFGLVRPDAGRMRLGGKPYTPSGPAAARAAGIAMVFQHFSLFEALTVAENIALGLPKRHPRRMLAIRIKEVSARYGLAVDPYRRVADLGVGERQRVEIVRCLLQNPRLLIMDEPTSVLTPQEVQTLFAALNQLRSEGVSVLYISHKLEEIRAICDRATVLRRGRVVARCIPAEETAESLAEMMIGVRVIRPAKREAEPGAVALSLRNLSIPADGPFGTTLRDISLDIHEGEVMGIAGVAGNGQEALFAALSGERRTRRKMVVLHDEPVGHMGPNRRRRRGLSSAPEERLGHAAAPTMSLSENTMLTARRRARLARGGFLKWAASAHFTRAVIEAFDVRTPSVGSTAGSLSGGNLQKFVIGRELMQNPSVFVVNQPTWGVDAAAAAAIRGALRSLASEGAAVLVISQDIDELLDLSDRIAVMAGGRLSAPERPSALTIGRIGQMMEDIAEAADAAA